MNDYQNKNLTDAELAQLHQLQRSSADKYLWIELMDLVHETMPDLLGRGKPSNEMIAKSLVGKCYFSSFGEFRSADYSDGGLSITDNQWNALGRAYRLVLKHDYIRKSSYRVTVSKINNMAAKNPIFPANENDYYLLAHAKADGRRKDNSKELADARNEAQRAAINYKTALEDYEKENIKNSELNKQLTSLSEQNAALTSENVQLRATAAKIGSMGFLQRLLFVFKSQ